MEHILVRVFRNSPLQEQVMRYLNPIDLLRLVRVSTGLRASILNDNYVLSSTFRRYYGPLIGLMVIYSIPGFRMNLNLIQIFLEWLKAYEVSQGLRPKIDRWKSNLQKTLPMASEKFVDLLLKDILQHEFIIIDSYYKLGDYFPFVPGKLELILADWMSKEHLHSEKHLIALVQQMCVFESQWFERSFHRQCLRLACSSTPSIRSFLSFRGTFEKIKGFPPFAFPQLEFFFSAVLFNCYFFSQTLKCFLEYEDDFLSTSESILCHLTTLFELEAQHSPRPFLKETKRFSFMLEWLWSLEEHCYHRCFAAGIESFFEPKNRVRLEKLVGDDSTLNQGSAYFKCIMKELPLKYTMHQRSIYNMTDFLVESLKKQKIGLVRQLILLNTELSGKIFLMLDSKIQFKILDCLIIQPSKLIPSNNTVLIYWKHFEHAEHWSFARQLLEKANLKVKFKVAKKALRTISKKSTPPAAGIRFRGLLKFLNFLLSSTSKFSKLDRKQSKILEKLNDSLSEQTEKKTVN